MGDSAKIYCVIFLNITATLIDGNFCRKCGNILANIKRQGASPEKLAPSVGPTYRGNNKNFNIMCTQFAKCCVKAQLNRDYYFARNSFVK